MIDDRTPLKYPHLFASLRTGRLRLRNRRTDVPVRFDAWIQRDEPGWNTSRFSVQSFFESASPGVVVGGAAGGLSNLATGSQTIVVGATRAEDGQLSRYTSLGGRPRRDGVAKREIDVAAPADESNTAIGLLAAAVRSGMLLRMGGTSVAAPVDISVGLPVRAASSIRRRWVIS